jgi:hypothetical protein
MATKKHGKAAPEPSAPIENRYARAARILILEGEGLPLEELAVKAQMSVSTAGHCLAAFQGVTAMLREAKVLPAKLAPSPKAPVAPKAEPKPGLVKAEPPKAP